MERKCGSSLSIFWWDQPMNLDNEIPDGANELAHPSFAMDMANAVKSQLNWWLDGGSGPGDTSFLNNLEVIANDILAWCTSSRAALRESLTKFLGAWFVMRAMEKAANDTTEACSLNAFLARLSSRLSWLVILATDSINSAMWANADVSPIQDEVSPHSSETMDDATRLCQLESTKGHPIAVGAQVPSSRRGSGTLANVSLATSMSCSWSSGKDTITLFLTSLL